MRRNVAKSAARDAFVLRLVHTLVDMSNEYQAYLVRFTRKSPAAHWRATLQNAHGTDVKHFASETDLLHFLARQLRESGADDNQADSPSKSAQRA